MTEDSSTYTSIPWGSLILRPMEEEKKYIQLMDELPRSIKQFLGSGHTGAYLRGLTKTHNLPLEDSSRLAFFILQISFGEKPLAQLPSRLSSELKIPNDKANSIAKEIEKDLFPPIAMELNQYLAKKKQQGTGKSMADKLGTSTAPNPASRQANPPVGPVGTPQAGPTPIVKRGAPLKPQNILNLRDQRNPPAPPVIPRRG